MQTLSNEFQTPWGKTQTVTELGKGIWYITTDCHGGYYVSPERNKEIPLSCQLSTLSGQGVHGFYEKDYDADFVRLSLKFFP